MKTYPVFLVGLDGRRAVVVGGDHEAERKVAGLREAGAAVTVIAAEPTAGLCAAIARGEVAHVPRDHRPGDLTGAFLVVCTARDEATRERVFRDARAAGALLNTVDDVPRSDFIAGSLVKSGELTVAISTGGAAPALAVRLRERLERELGPEYGLFLELAAAMRAPLLAACPDFAERRRRWYRLVDSDVLERLRAGDRQGAQERVDALLERGRENRGPA